MLSILFNHHSPPNVVHDMRKCWRSQIIFAFRAPQRTIVIILSRRWCHFQIYLSLRNVLEAQLHLPIHVLHGFLLCELMRRPLITSITMFAVKRKPDITVPCLGGHVAPPCEGYPSAPDRDIACSRRERATLPVPMTTSVAVGYLDWPRCQVSSCCTNDVPLD